MSLFETGQVVTTCGIAQAMRDDYSFLLSVRECLDRHCRGDWGDVGDDSRRGPRSRGERTVLGQPVQSLHHRRQRNLHHHGVRQVGDDHTVPGRVLTTGRRSPSDLQTLPVESNPSRTDRMIQRSMNYIFSHNDSEYTMFNSCPYCDRTMPISMTARQTLLIKESSATYRPWIIIGHQTLIVLGWCHDHQPGIQACRLGIHVGGVV